MPYGRRPKCKFLTCFYGMGLVGKGICDVGGQWWSPKCNKYKEEESVLGEWENAKKGSE